MEVIGAFAADKMAWAGGLSPAQLCAVTAAVLILCRLAWRDLCEMILPDTLTMAFALLGFLVASGCPFAGMDPASALMGTALGGGFMLVIRLRMGSKLGREALGLGDVKLVAAAGTWFGPLGVPVYLLLAVALGLGTFALIGTLRARAGLDPVRVVPFGPALCLAAVILVCAQAAGAAPASAIFALL